MHRENSDGFQYNICYTDFMMQEEIDISVKVIEERGEMRLWTK